MTRNEHFSYLHGFPPPPLEWKPLKQGLCIFHHYVPRTVLCALLALNRRLSRECVHARGDLWGKVWGSSCFRGLLKSWFRWIAFCGHLGMTSTRVEKENSWSVPPMCHSLVRSLKILGEPLAGCPCTSVPLASEVTVLSTAWECREDEMWQCRCRVSLEPGTE